MAYGQPPPLPPWATPAPDPSALPANDLGADPFLAWLHGPAPAQPILPPPPESPVPDVAWSGPPPIEFTADEASADAPDARAQRLAPWDAAGDVDPALTGNQDPTTRKPINPYGPGYVDPDVDPALTGSQDPTVRKPSDPYGPGYIDPDVDPALVGDQDPTIRKPLDPYANGDVAWGGPPLPWDAADIEAGPDPEPLDPYADPSLIESDVDPALTGSQDPTLRKPADPYAPPPGGETIAPSRTLAGPVGAMPSPADRAEQDRLTTPLDPYDPGAIDARRNAMADAYANADPEERLRMQAREQALQASQRQIMELDASERDRQALEEAVAIRKAARAKADAETADLAASAKAMADASPIESWWADRSTGAKIANVVAAVFGGLMSSKTGGRNSAIDTMMQVADADAAQKWKKLQARREINADARQAAEDDFLGAERVRLASREQMRRTLEAKLAGLDPEGTQAIQLGEAIAASRAADEAALRKFNADKDKRNQEWATIDIAQKQLELNAWKEQQAAELARLKFQRAGQAAAKPAGLLGKGATYPAKVWAGLVKGLDVSAFNPDQMLTSEDVTKLLDLQGKSGQIGIEEARNRSVTQQTQQSKKQFEDEREITFGGKPLYVYGDDGKPVLDAFGEPQRVTAQTPDEGKEIRKQVPNNTRAIELLYEAKAIREAMATGASKLPWAKPKQRLDAIGAEVVKLMKAGTQGMSSDEDMNKIAAAAGVKNLGSIVGQDAAIDQGIRLITDGLNSELRNHYKYNGPPVTVPNPYANAPKRDEDVARLNKRAPQPGFFSRQTWDPTTAFDDHDGLSAENKAGLGNLVAAVERGDADSPAKAAALADAAVAGRGGWNDDTGASNAVRAASAAELWRLKSAGNPAAVAAFDRLDPSQQAALISHLPAKEANAAFAAALRPKRGEE